MSCPYPGLSTPSDLAMQGSTVMRQSRAETLVTEEPDAFMAHVRVCGGAGWGNHWLYPEGDGVQRPLRFSFQPRLTPSVRVCRDKPARCEGVEVSDSEGLANHTGSESCASLGHGACEALTGERAGRV
jgi:hypothetical protein